MTSDEFKKMIARAQDINEDVRQTRDYSHHLPLQMIKSGWRIQREESSIFGIEYQIELLNINNRHRWGRRRTNYTNIDQISIFGISGVPLHYHRQARAALEAAFREAENDDILEAQGIDIEKYEIDE